MRPKEYSAQPGSSLREHMIVDDLTSRGTTQPKKSFSSVTPLEYPSKDPAHSPQDPKTVDTIYKIVYSDRHEYSLNGNVYIRYDVPPERDSTGWFCIVAFHWQDVQAEFECVYHPSIKLFDDFKPVGGSLRGGSEGVQSVRISMWNFADRGPDLNAKHTVKDDNENRIMLAVMAVGDGSAVRLYGKMVRGGEDENEVWLSEDERGRLGLRS
ncbi:hypothetical protein HO133_009052 [Letharia lupina]|uniref:Uncharacterized protein n=1 Tax=Letharia lupina TaxID=560253 RepID=A0A8H6CN69_9LECA|nr:uncharacterized protein HO133_009052 [Letharia lupina]KAF6226186.1 hypothetical protein HO133_009052 [Letharia lupina]